MRPGAGLEQQRVVLERRQRIADRREPARVVELLVRPVADARLVAEKLARGDRPRLLREGGHVALDRRVEVEAPALDELQDRDRGDRLRDRSQAVHGGGRGRHLVLDVGQAVPGRPAQLAVADDGGGQAGHSEPGHAGQDHGLDGGRAPRGQVGEAGRDRSAAPGTRPCRRGDGGGEGDGGDGGRRRARRGAASPRGGDGACAQRRPRP